MKKILIMLLAVILVACGTPATATEQVIPTEVQPSLTPVVIIQTVVVEPTQAPTEALLPTAPPTAVPPTAAPVVVTVVVEPTQAVAPTAAPTDTSGNLITIDNTLGAGWFVNITLTGNALSLRCQLYKEITFTVTPTDANITQVDFYYRIEDRATGATFDWQNVGRMLADANGNFVLVFSGEDVNPNFRKANAWLDFQFVGLSKTGGVVGRSEKIVQQVTYTLDCP